MDKTEIIEYIKTSKYAEPAALQKKFGISYREAKSIILELIANEDLVFSGGVRYDFVGRNKSLREERRADLERRREELIRRMQAEAEDDEDFEDEDDEDNGLDPETERKIEEYLEYVNHESRKDKEGERCDNIIARMLSSSADGKITRRRKAPVTADPIPSHSSWDNEEEFAQAVIERIECLVKSDMKMGRQGAVKIAETCLEAIRDTNDRKKIQVYERLVYELKNTSPYLYGLLKKQLCEEW